jgi:hypothetical protein
MPPCKLVHYTNITTLSLSYATRPLDKVALGSSRLRILIFTSLAPRFPLTAWVSPLLLSRDALLDLVDDLACLGLGGV